MTLSPIPNERIRRLGAREENPKGTHVLYWMTASRRVHYNFALEHAIRFAQIRGVPLVILEALRIDYPWASDRHHTAIIAGMRDNQRTLKHYPVQYYPYIEPTVGAGRGLLEALAKDACAVVTDDSPISFLPNMLASVAGKLSVPLEAIDSNGLYPARATDRVFTTAASFRRHLQKELPVHFAQMPRKNPLARVALPAFAKIPERILRRWPPANLATSYPIHELTIDHSVPAVAIKPGPKAAQKALTSFLAEHYSDYLELRNQPEARCQSYLSSHLHYGHISAHDIFLQIMKREQWSPERLTLRPNGSRHGWWGVSETAEAFLDQLITWRELGFNKATLQLDYREYKSLPAWALDSLEKHKADVREYQYTLRDFEYGKTHDALWNAAQSQLREEGIIHNYLRMLWGKKILEWSPTPRTALRTMIQLNNKYAIDGRDPNSYSGIFWILGRYDRAWGPERPVFGKVRYMSSANTARKLRVKNYVEQYSAS